MLRYNKYQRLKGGENSTIMEGVKTFRSTLHISSMMLLKWSYYEKRHFENIIEITLHNKCM